MTSFVKQIEVIKRTKWCGVDCWEVNRNVNKCTIDLVLRNSIPDDVDVCEVWNDGHVSQRSRGPRDSDPSYRVDTHNVTHFWFYNTKTNEAYDMPILDIKMTSY
jgi:hypothetical protein